MEKRDQSEDRLLVRECLAGKEEAWKEFYCRFIGLMRSVARKQVRRSQDDVEDVTQSAFLTLTTALKKYDFEQSLPRFVCLVTERVLINEYRRATAAKRESELDPRGLSTTDEVPTTMFSPDSGLQDKQLETAEMASRLRSAVQGLDLKCRELIELRYFRELPFNEIAEVFGESENTVTVQTRRCLDKLRAWFKERDRRGSG